MPTRSGRLTQSSWPSQSCPRRSSPFGVEDRPERRRAVPSDGASPVLVCTSWARRITLSSVIDTPTASSRLVSSSDCRTAADGRFAASYRTMCRRVRTICSGMINIAVELEDPTVGPVRGGPGHHARDVSAGRPHAPRRGRRSWSSPPGGSPALPADHEGGMAAGVGLIISATCRLNPSLSHTFDQLRAVGQAYVELFVRVGYAEVPLSSRPDHAVPTPGSPAAALTPAPSRGQLAIARAVRQIHGRLLEPPGKPRRDLRLAYCAAA